MKDTITKTHQFSQSIQKVWNAISKEDEISEWFIQAQFQAIEGAEYTFTHEKTTIKGFIKKVNPTFLLSYTWEVVGTDVETLVTWQLEERNGGTFLTLTHAGIENYPSEAMVTTMFENFSAGWNSCITNLEKHLKQAAHAK